MINVFDYTVYRVKLNFDHPLIKWTGHRYILDREFVEFLQSQSIWVSAITSRDELSTIHYSDFAVSYHARRFPLYCYHFNILLSHKELVYLKLLFGSVDFFEPKTTISITNSIRYCYLSDIIPSKDEKRLKELFAQLLLEMKLEFDNILLINRNGIRAKIAYKDLLNFVIGKTVYEAKYALDADLISLKSKFNVSWHYLPAYLDLINLITEIYRRPIMIDEWPAYRRLPI